MTALPLRSAVHCVLGLGAALLVGCAPAPEPAPRPQQAGQPLDPAETAVRMAALQGAAVAGDQAAVRRNFEAMHGDLMRAMKIPDPARRIDPEAARIAARAVPGVRSVAWIDRENLLALVDGPAYRTQATLDTICLQLEPLGDTLAVVVNLQDATARTGDALEVLSRNCQLAAGDRAFMQRNRQVDVVAPAVRAQHRANQDATQQARSRKSTDDAANSAALEAIPEM